MLKEGKSDKLKDLKERGSKRREKRERVNMWKKMENTRVRKNGRRRTRKRTNVRKREREREREREGGQVSEKPRMNAKQKKRESPLIAWCDCFPLDSRYVS